jgi:putative hydrolase of the HAD superfamily
MIKAIIFDCFGVLVGKSFWDVYAIAGGDPIKDSDFIDKMIKQSSGGTITDEEFSKIIADRLGLPVETYRAIYDREEQPNMPLFNYIRTELKPKYKIAMLSNVNRGVIERKIPEELRKIFDELVISAEVGAQKPDPKIFELTVHRLGVDYDETVFIDDRQEYLNPAVQLGIRTIKYIDLDSFKPQLIAML